MKTDRFYKTNGYVGSSVLFWAMSGCGYTTNIDLAHVYTREEAQRDVNNEWLRDEDEFPLSADDVDSLSEWRVDCQYVKKTYPEFTDPNDEYVAYRKGHFDGNDLGFAAILSHDYDYSSARVFTEKEVAAINTEGWVVIPKYHTDEVARRTFQKKNINRRKMITGAGITGMRKKRRSKATGKTRFNCVICGKIVWEFAHPDDFEIMTCSHACETTRESKKYLRH
ncbi:hypothetical protein KW500_18380 [Vibrio fluvialis]|nr:hypothetical protein [Vibrio fluvialis]MBY8138782.1 hypothetical protein [Vibrio fluvialis]